MFISLYGLGLATFLLAGALVARMVIGTAFARTDAAEARALGADALAGKRRMRGIVMMILNADIIAMPIIGYALGHFFLEPR